MEGDVAKWREALIDAAVELDDAAMEAYLEVNLLVPEKVPCGFHFWGSVVFQVPEEPIILSPWGLV